jgi:DNA modification methylase
MNIIEFGDCRETMRKWAKEGVKAQTCVTSPPYYGLRDYGRDGQIGLEETPEQYIQAMVEVFRCVWDVLADDGTLWLNIGDSYASGGGKAQPHRNNSGGFGGSDGERTQGYAKAGGGFNRPATVGGQVKTKDLIGIPWMLAFALRADGWYLRQDIIWHKPNPMPESVQDRCTKAHEYIFLLSKSQKYHFDHEAIREKGEMTAEDSAGSVQRDTRETHGVGGGNSGINKAKQKLAEELATLGYSTRNKRSVWTVPTKPFKGAHFATFPQELIEPCILAGAPVGGIVLDPFMGSGTTAQVAQNLGRQYIGCELNTDYKPLQDKRVAQQALVL